MGLQHGFSLCQNCLKQKREKRICCTTAMRGSFSVVSIVIATRKIIKRCKNSIPFQVSKSGPVEPDPGDWLRSATDAIVPKHMANSNTL